MPKTLQDFVREALALVDEVEPECALSDSGCLILDVREPDEFAAGHIPGSINIPRGFLEVKADHDHPKRDERLQDRSLRILTFCGGGHRSALAAATLYQMGFCECKSIRGGWTLWQSRGLPTEGPE
ncbi:MAG: hypothetical protein MH204_12030 [Fimbriimonadaceae bacterium]|nr:hypothetical protein [Fimbriimonadaceae bacterium]